MAAAAIPPGSADAGPWPVVWKRTWVDDRAALYGRCGEGVPVLLLHGWGLGQHAYRRVMQELAARGADVVAPALPGFGGTADLPARTFSLAGYAAWVAQFCEALHLDEPAMVIGHSFGGGVAVRLAHDHPERVRSLVLVNSIGGSAWRKGNALRSIAERPLWDWGLHFPSDIWPVPQATRVLPVILEDAVPNLVRNPRAILRVAGLARRADLLQELEELNRRRLPVTVIWGKRDGVIPQASFERMCLALGAEGTVVEGSHSWLLADPESFGEVITNDLAVARIAREVAAAAAASAEREHAARPPRRRRWHRDAAAG